MCSVSGGGRGERGFTSTESSYDRTGQRDCVDSVEVVEFPIKDIKIRFRLRTPCDQKVNGIVDSIAKIGLISPITIDGSNYLISGFHRVLAHKKLGKETIPTIIKGDDRRFNELIELDENLQRNELNHIEYSEHLVRREELMDQLGLTYSQGDNRFTKDTTKLSIQDLADGVGLSKRSYQQRKQITKINEEVRSLLVETEWADSLMDLVKLSSETEDIQRRVCDLLITGKVMSWKSALYEAKVQQYNLTTTPKLDFKVKDRFGLPKSIMKFNKCSSDLSEVIKRVNDDEELRHQKSSIRFGLAPVKLHSMNPDQCSFSLDYYTNPNDLILSPFNGRGTEAITSLYLQRRFIGFEINKTSLDKTSQVIKENMTVPEDHWRIIEGCGCEMKELQGESEIIDAVFSSPPYYGKVENYNSDPRDLCNMTMDQYDKKIDQMFGNISRLIKKSDYEKKVFHPIIFTLGNSRNGKHGILDLTYTFQTIAKQYGLTYWDDMTIENTSPFIVATLQRNYEHRIVQKTHERQMVWVKF